LGLFREKGRHVPILAHPEENQIENRLAFTPGRNDPHYLGLRLVGGSLRRLFSSNAVNLILGNAQRSEQKFLSQGEIALRILGRNATFIAPEKMDGCEGGRFSFAQPRSGGEELARNSPSGKRDTEWISPNICARNLAKPLARSDFGQFVRAGKRNDIESAHVRSATLRLIIFSIHSPPEARANRGHFEPANHRRRRVPRFPPHKIRDSRAACFPRLCECYPQSARRFPLHHAG